MEAEAGGLLGSLSDGFDSSDEDDMGHSSGGKDARQVHLRRVKTPDMDLSQSIAIATRANRSKALEPLPSVGAIRQYLSQSRPSTGMTSRRGSVGSQVDAGEVEIDLGTLVGLVEGLMREGKHSDAASKAVDGMRVHPYSDELRQLADEATERLKRYPRFSESLAFVTLVGPSGAVTIGNGLEAAYIYSHMTPKTEFKRFAPISKTVRSKVAQYDSKFPTGRMAEDFDPVKPSAADESVLDGTMSPHYLPAGLIEELPEKRMEMGVQWTEEEEGVLREVYMELEGKVRVKDMVAVAVGRLREELHVEIEPMLKMIRLYETVANLDAVQLCASHRQHQKHDQVALFKVKRSNLRNVEAIKDTWQGLIKAIDVPPGDEGKIDFSDCALSEGLHEFRYFIAGSDTPACISQPFTTVKPLSTINVPSEVVACGDAFRISYSIPISRPHSPQDWIGIYGLAGCGPKGQVMAIRLPEANHGDIHIPHTPDFPGDYEAKLHMGGHADVVVGTSKPLRVRLRVRSPRAAAREVRVFLCSTVIDMQAERSAIVNIVVPELQAMFEDQFITITMIPMSWGQRRRDVDAAGSSLQGGEDRERLTLSDVTIALDEIEACRPFFVAILGERRGATCPPIDQDTIAAYPWLKGQLLNHYSLPGRYSSLLELQILNGFLVEPEASKRAVFYFRDRDFARRAGLSRGELAKSLPESEVAREAVHNIKEELRSMQCRHEMYESTPGLSQSLIRHLSAAIREEHPACSMSWSQRICIAIDMLALDLREHATEHHPSFSNLSAQVELLLLSREPVVLKGPPSSGMSSLLASAAYEHIEALSNDPHVEWHGGKTPWGQGASACAYTVNGEDHLFLLHLAGNEMSVTNDADILEHAMTVTKDKLGLAIDIPWHVDDMIKLVPDWLDMVCEKVTFTWVIDGLDELLGPSSVEAVYSHEVRGKSEGNEKVMKSMQRGVQVVAEVKETIPDIEEKEKHRLLTARVHAQFNLRRWLVPLIDNAGDRCASIRFPKLRLVMALIDAEPAELMQAIRPLDTQLQAVINSDRSIPSIVEMQSWSANHRLAYVQHRVKNLGSGISPDCVQACLEHLLQVVRPPGEVTSSDTVVRDRFASTHFMVSYVNDVLSFCEARASNTELHERFELLNKCETLEALHIRQLKNLRRNRGAETAFKLLFLSKVGMREMELLKLVGERDDVTGEELTLLFRHIRHVTIRIAGFIQLRSKYKRVAWKLFKSVENRLELTMDMLNHFTLDRNCMRRAQELPVLLLRQAKTDLLLDFVCRQANIAHLGKRQLLNLFKIVGWSSEVMANMLKNSFETHFGIDAVASGRKYDIQKLQEQAQDVRPIASETPGLGSNLQSTCALRLRIPPEYAGLPSKRRKWLCHQHVLGFCSGALDTVDFLLKLEATALEMAEAILESLVKMLHQADSLALVAERSTKYPIQSLECMRLWCIVFSLALKTLPAPGEEISSSAARHDQRAKNHSRAVQELIFAKIKLLVQAVFRIQEDCSSAKSWKDLVADESMLEVMPEGVPVKCAMVLTLLKQLAQTITGEGADDVPRLRLERGGLRGR